MGRDLLSAQRAPYDERPIDETAFQRMRVEARSTRPLVEEPAGWDFVVVTDRDRLRDLSKVWRYAEHVASSAATVALVAPASSDPDERETIQFDLGQAAMNLMLAAVDQGIGSGHAAVEDQALAREVLGLPDDCECMWLIALGFPADRPLAPVEHPLAARSTRSCTGSAGKPSSNTPGRRLLFAARSGTDRSGATPLPRDAVDTVSLDAIWRTRSMPRPRARASPALFASTASVTSCSRERPTASPTALTASPTRSTRSSRPPAARRASRRSRS